MPEREDELTISVDDARQHAVLTIAQGVAAGLPDLVSLGRATLRKDPVIVHDLNGQVLFYDFVLIRGEEEVGYVRVAANMAVGTPGVAIEIGTRHWDFDRAVKKLAAGVRREFPQAGSGPRLVCYSYPKLGVMFDVAGANEPVVFDVASLDRIPPLREDREGAFAWSFLDSIPRRERTRRIARYRAIDEARLALSADLRRARTVQSVVEALDLKARFKSTKSRTLQYCNHYAETEPRSHHCFSLHAQQVNDYCAVATCQMVLCYYRYYFSQDQIAPALGYTAGNGCPPDQSPGYESLTCRHIDAAFDGSPTFNTARAQIDALHPFKSGVPGHARACAGYSLTSWIFASSIIDRKLYIYDPWPWNADLKLGGAVYWEDWDSITHTNYVTTRIDCP